MFHNSFANFVNNFKNIFAPLRILSLSLNTAGLEKVFRAIVSISFPINCKIIVYNCRLYEQGMTNYKLDESVHIKKHNSVF